MKSQFMGFIKTLKMKHWVPLTLVLFVLTQALPTKADEFRRLEDSISTLKSKIRNSPTKDPKDIQKLYKLENELEKKMYLRKNNKAQ